MDRWFYPTFHYVCDYISMMGLKLNCVSKRNPISLYHASMSSWKQQTIFLTDIICRSLRQFDSQSARKCLLYERIMNIWCAKRIWVLQTHVCLSSQSGATSVVLSALRLLMNNAALMNDTLGTCRFRFFMVSILGQRPIPTSAHNVSEQAKSITILRSMTKFKIVATHIETVHAICFD